MTREQEKDRYYKVKLSSGRVLGPFDLARVKLFIGKGIISGLESVRMYPEGEWQDINLYPEIADLLFQKLEGRLELDPTDINVRLTPEELIKQDIEKIDVETASDVSESQERAAKNSPDDEKTVIRSKHEEKTVIRPRAESKWKKEVQSESQQIQLEGFEGQVNPQNIASEKTQFFKIESKDSPQQKNKLDILKKKPVLLALAAIVMILVFMPDESKKKSSTDKTPFVIEMPVPAVKADPSESTKLIAKALPYYVKDTVDGFRMSATILKKAVSLDQNNVKAICLLASAYLNLIDVQKRDEMFFAVITRLIELARAKGVDLSEMVIAEVELYLSLGNPDAAMKRIVDFTKSHEFGPEMYYYLSLVYFSKSEYENSFKYLNQMDRKTWFGQKIPYLYSRIFLKNSQKEDSRKALEEVIKNSPTHIKARVDLIEIDFSTDKFDNALSHTDFVVENAHLASRRELAKSLYYRGRVMASKGDLDAAASDLSQATKYLPDEPTYLLEYYTIRSRLGEKVKDAKSKAKMYAELARGEEAILNGKLSEAEAHYLTARQADEQDALPLVKLANIFKLKGDLQSAKISMSKAITLTAGKPDHYPAYIKILIEDYEFEEALKQVEIYKGLGPSAVELDKINGDLNYKRAHYDKAEAYYKRALSDANAESSTYNNFADVLFAKNNFKDAAFFYGLALRFDTFNVKSISGIAKALSEVEGLQAGIEYIQAAMKINPKKAELMNATAEVFLRKGDYQNAMKSADQAHAYDASLAIVYKTKADIYSAMEKVREALDHYLSYSNLAPWDPEGRIARCNLYAKKLDYASAIDEIQKVISVYPRYPGAYTKLGELYKEAQNYKSAFEAAKQELIFNPDHIPAYVLAATALNALKEAQNAMDYINRALKLNQNYIPLLIQAGETNRILKNYHASKTLLERALSQDQGNPQIHKRLGMLYYEMNDKNKGRQHFRAYLDYLPDAKDKSEIERLLNN